MLLGFLMAVDAWELQELVVGLDLKSQLLVRFLSSSWCHNGVMWIGKT